MVAGQTFVDLQHIYDKSVLCVHLQLVTEQEENVKIKCLIQLIQNVLPIKLRNRTH
ncbi:Protein of unknown function [Gryllus bimaculatus]|nr:Protein of unknown function [Gryllus bimaculatus]